MKQYYVYLTTNLINNKKYIGQHYGELEDSYLGSGNIFKKALVKYGKNNFKKTILEICQDYNSLNIAEKKWIQYYNAVDSDNFYNIATGGQNSNPVAGLSPDQEFKRRQKISKSLSGENNPMYGVHIQKEQHPFYGKHHKESSKIKMSQAKKDGKAPTAKAVAIYDLNGKFIRRFETQRLLKIYLGLSPNGSTDTLKKYIKEEKVYHGYIVKYID